mmetsp:Transcript_13972/g.30864  ORF Transcript_13972/g.30864 Transcript_13972/m.30864 type:complete len:200 (+) Transcript_13972:1407-2006(+)
MGPNLGLRYTPKIVPVGRPLSTFEDPSRGSKTAANSPEKALLSTTSEHKQGSSSSSEAMMLIFWLQHRACFIIEFAMTSSFFWSSPWMLTLFPPVVEAWCPPKLSVDILLMSLLISLQADSMLHRMGYRDSSSGCLQSSTCMKRLNVFFSTVLVFSFSMDPIFEISNFELKRTVGAALPRCSSLCSNFGCRTKAWDRHC